MARRRTPKEAEARWLAADAFRLEQERRRKAGIISRNLATDMAMAERNLSDAEITTRSPKATKGAIHQLMPVEIAIRRSTRVLGPELAQSVNARTRKDRKIDCPDSGDTFVIADLNVLLDAVKGGRRAQACASILSLAEESKIVLVTSTPIKDEINLVGGLTKLSTETTLPSVTLYPQDKQRLSKALAKSERVDVHYRTGQGWGCRIEERDPQDAKYGDALDVLATKGYRGKLITQDKAVLSADPVMPEDIANRTILRPEDFLTLLAAQGLLGEKKEEI